MLQSVCWAGQRPLRSFCTCWEVRPRKHQNSSLALEARLGQGQGLGPSSMEMGLLLQERQPLLTLPEVGCAPPGWGQEGSSWCSWHCATSSPEPLLSAVVRAGAVSPWLIPGAGTPWEVLPATHGLTVAQSPLKSSSARVNLYESCAYSVVFFSLL